MPCLVWSYSYSSALDFRELEASPSVFQVGKCGSNDATSQALTRRRHPDFALKSRGILRLANKYGLADIKAHFITRFKSDWPKSLQEWYTAVQCEDSTLAPPVIVENWP